ncbi:MAG: DUF58 domain-containing protein [Saprospiraceae bacterium]
MSERIDDILKKVRQIEIKSKGLSTHLFSGKYHSTFKGRGMSFSEVRSYQYGDDVRNIDWNVSARTGDTHVKVFEEERELSLILMIDVSKSSFWGSGTQFKSDLMAEIVAVLAFSAAQNNDMTGLLLFSDKVELFIPPKKGKAHILYMLRTLLSYQPDHVKTDLSTAMEFVNKVIKRRSICFIMSDFVGADYQNKLSVLAKKHDVVGIKVNDDLECQLPNVGLLKVVDPETGQEFWLDSALSSFRNQYAQKFIEHENNFQEVFSKCGAEFLKIKTSASYIHALLAFFKNR